jgi:predicted RNase H-like HicB family nuclease
VIIERDTDGFYVASVPALPGCHTQAKSLDTLMKRVREAIELCLEVHAQPVDSSLRLMTDNRRESSSRIGRIYGLNSLEDQLQWK